MHFNKILKVNKSAINSNTSSWDANDLMAFFLCIGLMLGAVLNFIVEYMNRGKDLLEVLIFSLCLIFLGFMSKLIVSLKLPEKLTTHLLALMCFFIIPFITVKFQEIGGGSIWPVCFLFITGSLIFINRTMFIYICLSSILTQLFIWINIPQISIMVSSPSYITRIGLIIIVILIGYIVNKMYLNKLRENNAHINTIEQLAYYDHLTGLPNRLLFADQLEKAILKTKKTDKILAVLFLDLDAFKMINDTMGHDLGDQLLIELSKRLQDVLYPTDMVSRFGGDEFIVLINNLKNPNEVNLIAEKILGIFEKPFMLNNHECHVTASIGISLYPIDGENKDVLIKNADLAMYKAKARGRNQYEICTALMKISMAKNIELYNSLHLALERNELLLYYQPQVSYQSGKIIGVEALLRWNHPQLGMVAPGKFIPLAEQTGLISAIGDWVLLKACQQNKMWQDAGLPCIRMALNLSIHQFHNHQLVNRVSAILKETGLNPKYLELEITETIAMQETGYIIEVLQAFQALGITISIDDFGTEYSSLNYLKHLPVDRIKIAIPFVQGIGVSDKDEAITIAIIHLARNLGLNVIAEGVENKAQLVFLTRRMCNEIQGFYYYKPMPADEIEALLRNNTIIAAHD